MGTAILRCNTSRRSSNSVGTRDKHRRTAYPRLAPPLALCSSSLLVAVLAPIVFKRYFDESFRASSQLVPYVLIFAPRLSCCLPVWDKILPKVLESLYRHSTRTNHSNEPPEGCAGNGISPSTLQPRIVGLSLPATALGDKFRFHCAIYLSTSVLSPVRFA
jgi:hypothetical protein